MNKILKKLLNLVTRNYIQDLEEERDRAVALLTKCDIQDIGLKDGKLDLTVKTPMTQIMAEGFYETVKNAQNYVEVEFYHQKEQRFILVTVQKKEMQTPHQLRRISENRLAKAIALLKLCAFVDPGSNLGNAIEEFLKEVENA